MNTYSKRNASALAGCVAAIFCSATWLCGGLAMLAIQGVAA